MIVGENEMNGIVISGVRARVTTKFCDAGALASVRYAADGAESGWGCI